MLNRNLCGFLPKAELDLWHDLQVEVEGTEEGLRIHIECEKRPRVLAEIMEFLESSGLNVEEVSIDYHEDSHFSFDCVGSEVQSRLSHSVALH